MSARTMRETTELMDGEDVIAEFRPVFSVFLGKLLFAAALTTLFFGGVKAGPVPGLHLSLLPLSFLAYLFVFDDHQEWVRRRGDVWTLTNRRLHYSNAKERPGSAHVELGRVTRIGSWMFWAIRLRLNTGDVVTLSFLPERSSVRALISETAARQSEATT